MRTNDDIIVNYQNANVNHEDMLFTWVTCESAMKEAQVEALKELVKRSQDNILDYTFSTGKYKTTEQIALEMIKEIEP